MSGAASSSSKVTGANKSGKKVKKYKQELRGAIEDCELPKGFEKELYENISLVVLEMIDNAPIEAAIKQSFPEGMATRDGQTIAQVVSQIHPTSLAALYGWVHGLKGAIEDLTGYSKWID